MRSISNSTRSISNVSSSGKAGNFTDLVDGDDDVKELISKANSVPLMRLFRYYGIRIDEVNRFIVCPFKSHKGGRENSASFKFYPETNSFWCFGCKTGITPVVFVATMENINYVRAAYKIIESFSEDIDEDNVFDRDNFSERLEIMMDFSNVIREFREKFSSEKSFEYIEEICSHYDAVNLKHDLNNEALHHIVDQYKHIISLYNE